MAAPAVPHWQALLLNRLGAPLTPNNLRFLNSWLQAEGGTATNNPFNTTLSRPGATSYNSVGVRNYPTAQAGIEATAQTLQDPRYRGIVQGLRASADPAVDARALAASPWGTGSLVLKILGAGGGATAPSPPPAAAAPPAPAAPAAPAQPTVDPGLTRRLLATALLRSSRTGNYQPFFQTLGRIRQQAAQPPLAAPVAPPLPRSAPPVPAPVSLGPATPTGAYTHPAPSGSFLRVDQGVDYSSPRPVVSIGSGVVTKISPPGSWAGGTGQAVYVHLDKPVTINGRTYRDVYYAEEKPLVGVGQRVRAGQPVIGPGGNELGFAQGGQPAAPLVGGLGAGTRPTTPGQDFLQFVRSLLRR